MKVKELIEKLSKLPLEAEVRKSSCEGCEECNPEGMDYYNDIYSVEFKEEGDYPNHKLKNIVVL